MYQRLLIDRPWLGSWIMLILLMGTLAFARSVRATPDVLLLAMPGNCPPDETETMFWPNLSQVTPASVAPGAAVEVSGSGGYVYCSGGLYNESARSFDLTLDGVVLGTLQCYVNHCQTTITIPIDTTAGEHIIATEGGSQLVIQIQSRAASQVIYLPMLIK